MPTKVPMATRTTMMVRPNRNRSGQLLFFEDNNKDRLERTSDHNGNRMHEDHIFFKQVSPRSYFKDEGTSE